MTTKQNVVLLFFSGKCFSELFFALMKALMFGLCFLAYLFGVSFASAEMPRGTRFSIATGGLMGVYYPTGGAICRLVNMNMSNYGLICSTRPTDGSQDNINLVQYGTDEFGIAQADKLYTSYNSGVAPDIRAIMSLYSEVVTLIVAKGSRVSRLGDMKGKAIDIGQHGSGDRYIMSQIFEQMGWNISDFSKVSELGGIGALRAICDGKVDVAVVVAGHPNWIVSQATEKCGARLLSLDNAFLSALTSRLPYYSKIALPRDIYYGQGRILTFGIMSTLFTSSKVGDEMVYKVLSSIFGNLNSFRSSHPMLSEANFSTATRVTIPLHDAAVRFYQETGVTMSTERSGGSRRR